jgi:pectate lyase|tara:strand:+ start:1032 stop:1514 length:483 start_codon:yes stop_codon:yes gene_type:complete
MKIKIEDDFLPKDEFDNLKNILTGASFPWFYNDRITDKGDPAPFYYFTHMFYREPGITSEWFHLFHNFLNKIECKSILRLKGNLHVNQNITRKNRPHADYDFTHKGCIYYINTNNGATYFGKKAVLPKENRAVFFDPSLKHNSSECTDNKRRICINMNYF